MAYTQGSFSRWEGSLKKRFVIIATPNGDSFTITVLAKPMKVPYFSVVNVFRPANTRTSIRAGQSRYVRTQQRWRQ